MFRGGHDTIANNISQAFLGKMRKKERFIQHTVDNDRPTYIITRIVSFIVATKSNSNLLEVGAVRRFSRRQSAPQPTKTLTNAPPFCVIDDADLGDAMSPLDNVRVLRVGHHQLDEEVVVGMVPCCREWFTRRVRWIDRSIEIER